jgi:hypothetical protein
MKKIEEMELYEFCRWSALLEAIDLIDEQCKSNNKSFDDIDLKPLAIQKYVDTGAEDIQRKLEAEIKNAKDSKFKVKKEMVDP